ncbi:MAG: ATP-dependent dethiobiotin synthetase BioD [Hyphomicrobiaceae bacterium]|nr:ATP-dependent dethiobiotin synthetase BioD [Hyphomicrobiaceae bacterium]
MTRALIVTGTDTDIGKTVVSAGLVAALGADYWKPVQAGIAQGTDRDAVERLAGLVPGDPRIHPEVYRLETPASPHLAAERDGVIIDPRHLAPPETKRPLVIEGAGGLMVPLSRELLQIDLYAHWRFPVVLCASTRLGTINHTLLSIEALERRNIAIAGLVFVGDENIDSERTIVGFSGVASLGRLAWLAPLEPAALRASIETSLDLDRLRSALEQQA